MTPAEFETLAQLQLVHYVDRTDVLNSEGLHLERIAVLQEAEELAACADDPEYQFLYIPVTFGQSV